MWTRVLSLSLSNAASHVSSSSGDRQVSIRQISLYEKDGRCLPSLICLVMKLSYDLGPRVRSECFAEVHWSLCHSLSSGALLKVQIIKLSEEGL